MDRLFPSRSINILDGGMGTLLTPYLYHQSISNNIKEDNTPKAIGYRTKTPDNNHSQDSDSDSVSKKPEKILYPTQLQTDVLWSSSLLLTEEGRRVIKDAHREWIGDSDGAEIVETVSYQTSIPSFLSLSPSSSPSQYHNFQAENLMRLSVVLADQARKESLLRTTVIPASSSTSLHTTATSEEKGKPPLHNPSSSSPPIKLALSLGPLGACLIPGAEYSGDYPPPFGPRPGPSSSSKVSESEGQKLSRSGLPEPKVIWERYGRSRKTSTLMEMEMGTETGMESCAKDDGEKIEMRGDARVGRVEERELALTRWHFERVKTFLFPPSLPFPEGDSSSPPSMSSSSQLLDLGEGRDQKALEMGKEGFDDVGNPIRNSNYDPDKIDLIAFETIPLLTEVRAIRRAMSWISVERNNRNRNRNTRTTRSSNNNNASLEKENQKNLAIPPWYISLVFPATPPLPSPPPPPSESDIHWQRVDMSNMSSTNPNPRNIKIRTMTGGKYPNYENIQDEKMMDDILEGVFGSGSVASSSNNTTSKNNISEGDDDDDDDDIDDTDNISTPNGIGINCTKPYHLKNLVKGLEEGMIRRRRRRLLRKNPNNLKVKGHNFGEDSFSSSSLSSTLETESLPPPSPPPCLVLYPDGGMRYDSIGQTWIEDDDDDDDGNQNDRGEGGKESKWAETVIEVAEETLKARYPKNLHSDGSYDEIMEEKLGDLKESSSTRRQWIWGNVIVGGCCKTSSKHIRALRALRP